MAKKKEKKYILTYDLTVDEFLNVIKVANADQLYYPVRKFPTEKHLDDFLSKAHDMTESEFRDILRYFIPRSTTYGRDMQIKSSIIRNEGVGSNIKSLEEQARTSDHHIKDTEYFRRLTYSTSPNHMVWEGLTWILDLLPHFPQEAIKALNAYFKANCQFLPDDILDAIDDCNSMIRARYINKEHSREVFLNLAPKEFEKLVAYIYRDLGYEVSLTKASYDGGIDINAEKKLLGSKEKIIIQCKNYTAKIPIDEIRQLLGIVANGKLTKGVLVTSSDFTSEAKKFANQNPSIELINYKELIVLFNERHGPYWIYKIEHFIRDIS